MSTRKILTGLIALVVFGGAFLLYENHALTVAHSTFENYYAFRGCVELVDRTNTYGHCKTSEGKTIKIVMINGMWYLDGDGPGIW